MITDYNAETLRIHAENVTDKQERLAQVTQARDDAIRDAIKVGALPTELGRITGLSRGRIYQIKNQEETK